MRNLSRLVIKLSCLMGIVFVLKIAFGDSKGLESSVIDVRAALLVFLAPLLIYFLFQTQFIPIGLFMRRIKEVTQFNNKQLLTDLAKNAADARGEFGYSHVVTWSESHSDSMMRYAGEVFSSRFSAAELTEILYKQAQSEDDQWLALCQVFAFLAKMAPYFGMMATVIGMVKLLEKMSDFGDISSNMALAMQGTLYGLVSFLLFYSPLQKFFQEQRNKIIKRNEMIIEWFVLVSQGADPTYIQRELLAYSAFQKTDLLKESSSL